jgi:hypothetical protein
LSNFYRNTAALFLYLAWAVIIAHSVIPHDHHPDYSGSGNEATCTASKAAAGNHHHLPFCCHAFTDLACEKFSFTFEGSHHNFISFLFVPAHLDTCSGEIFSRQLNLPELKGLQSLSGFFKIYSFRAPPFLI